VQNYKFGPTVMKSARWRANEATFACGGTRCAEIVLVDTRMGGGSGGGGSGGGSGSGSALRMPTAVGDDVHNVRWSPLSCHTLLASGNGTSMAIHDVRSPRAPLLALNGHTTKPLTGYLMFTPSFSHGGRAVTTMGHESNLLSVYDVASGAKVWEATLRDAHGGVRGPMTAGGTVQAVSCGESGEALLLTDGKRVVVYAPQW
jgi:WD40 repeat protein